VRPLAPGELAIVAAVAANGVVGLRNALPWRLRNDLFRFRALTMGATLLLGRRTFQSIGRPLTGRRSVVLTRDAGFVADGAETVRSWEAALTACRDGAFVVGGPEIYALALPLVRRIHLTEVDARPEGDAFMPSFDRRAFAEIGREHRSAGPHDDHDHAFVELVRIG
jgi:dihydrofolate reductase